MDRGRNVAIQTRKSRAFIPTLIVAAMVTATLAACGTTSASSTSGTLVFGAPVSLTGSLSHEGTDTLNGYNLWADQVNANGGIKVGNTSYQVKIKYYDDASSSQKSAQLTRQLITSDKVNFMLGPYGSGATLTDEVIAQQYQVPMVEGNGAAQAISPMAIRTSSASSAQRQNTPERFSAPRSPNRTHLKRSPSSMPTTHSRLRWRQRQKRTPPAMA